MPNEYVDISLLRVVREDQTNVDLEDVVDFKPTVTKEKKVVNTMNRKRIAKGYTVATKVVTWEMTVPIRKGTPEFDWRKACANDEVLQFIVEEADGGKRRTFVDVVVNECSPEYSEAGESRMSVRGLALDEEGDDT